MAGATKTIIDETRVYDSSGPESASVGHYDTSGFVISNDKVTISNLSYAAETTSFYAFDSEGIHYEAHFVDAWTSHEILVYPPNGRLTSSWQTTGETSHLGDGNIGPATEWEATYTHFTGHYRMTAPDGQYDMLNYQEKTTTETVDALYLKHDHIVMTPNDAGLETHWSNPPQQWELLN